MVEIKGISSRQEIKEKHLNGEFLAEHYVEPPYYAVEASERQRLENAYEDKKPPKR